MPSELKPCPFCGGPAREPGKDKVRPGRAPNPRWTVGCACWCVTIQRRNKKDAIADWNTRVDPLRDRLVKALGGMVQVALIGTSEDDIVCKPFYAEARAVLEEAKRHEG